MTVAPGFVHVVVAVVRQHDGPDAPVLVARRHQDAHQGGLLELPGGKVEPGESPQGALCRELQEELGLTVVPAHLTPLIQVQHDYGDRRVLLDAWTVERFTGTPRGREGQPLQWMLPGALQDTDFPVANRGIIRAIQLPRTLLITGSATDQDRLERLRQNLAAAPEGLCLFRAPELNPQSYRESCAALLPICESLSVALMLHGDPAHLALCPQAAGVHLPWQWAKTLAARPIADGYWLGVSCHNPAELAHAQGIGADYATLSPVNVTASHPGAGAMGWEAFAAQVSAVNLPVYALGGLTREQLQDARRHGAQGVAGIRFWWDA
ncbi:MAG: Nudix family hydrolase [Halomonadaceae bacterium]|nr:MAG: Nudix family hydrolase [Halomonadaceae bacterium]